MTERERLVEIIMNGCKPLISPTQAGRAADALLANGVIVLPRKVGQPVWIVYTPRWPADPADKGKWFVEKDGVQRVLIGTKGFSIETWNMGTYAETKLGETLFLTEEEALAAWAAKNNKQQEE